MGASREAIAADAKEAATAYERALKQVEEFRLLADVRSWFPFCLPSHLFGSAWSSMLNNNVHRYSKPLWNTGKNAGKSFDRTSRLARKLSLRTF